MQPLLFVFGRVPELSQAELATFTSFTPLTKEVALVSDATAIDPIGIMPRLGGTVKIAYLLGEPVETTSDSLYQLILPHVSGKRITFGISHYGDVNTISSSLLDEVKDLLVSSGIAVRFVRAHEGKVLSSVVIEKQAVIEFLLITAGGKNYFAKTVAVQPFADWNRRDFDRPVSDAKSGMLPVKVARMIVNIALGSLPGFDTGEPKTILDPFCGMGTILAEGLFSGADVVGIDQSEKAISSTRKNLDWLGEVYPQVGKLKYELYQADATHASWVLAPKSVDAIVTEPFMGSTRLGGKDQSAVSVQQLKNSLKGVEKLYLGCLKDWHKVLKPRGVVVMAIPTYHAAGRQLRVKNVIDRCEILGYTRAIGPIEYSRPQAVVRREFYSFIKIG